MLNTGGAFNNEDPLANIEELNGLNTPQGAFFLVLGNLAGLWATHIAARLGCFVLAGMIIISLIVSWFYHLCQTTHECFQFTLPDWVSIDHFTSTSMLALIFHYELNVLTVCQLVREKLVLKLSRCAKQPSVITEALERKRKSCKKPRNGKCESEHDILAILAIYKPSIYENALLDVDRCGCGQPIERHLKCGTLPGGGIRENGFYDAWSSITGITIIVIVAIAVYAHPFSYAAFNIVIACSLVFWFISILYKDEGNPRNFHNRISWPEFILSLILSVIGLAAYVTDSYVEYMILHSLWHVAIYIATGFFLTGTMKSVNGWKPLIKWPLC